MTVTATGEKTHWTIDELVIEAARRFGPDQADWGFICPRCSTVSTVADFLHRGITTDALGQDCIGRWLGALNEPDGQGPDYTGPGCDWAAYGVLMQGPWWIEIDGREVPSFRLAPARVES